MVSTEKTLMSGSLEKGRQEGRQEGLQEGLQKGLEKGLQQGLQQGLERERLLLLHLLQRRFGALSTDCQERIAGADEHQLSRWSERILDAPTLQDIFAD